MSGRAVHHEGAAEFDKVPLPADDLGDVHSDPNLVFQTAEMFLGLRLGFGSVRLVLSLARNGLSDVV